MGKLGRKRTFFVSEKNVKIPSDLAGINATYYSKRDDQNMKAALSVASTRIIETITTLGRTDDHKKAEATNLETEQRTVRATTLTRYTYTPPPTPGDIYIVLEKTDRSNKIDFAIQWAGWKESGSRDVGDSEGLILKLKHNNHDDFPIKLNTNATRLVFKQYPKDDGPDQLDQDYDKEDL